MIFFIYVMYLDKIHMRYLHMYDRSKRIRTFIARATNRLSVVANGADGIAGERDRDFAGKK